MNGFPETLGQPDALLGLLGWLVQLDDLNASRQVPLAAGGTMVIVDLAVSNGFQVGFATDEGAFLAYSGDLQWFGHAWEGAVVGAFGVALIAANPAPLAVVLRTDLPLSLAAFAERCREVGRLALCPFAEDYLDRLAGSTAGQRRSVADRADLDATHRTWIPVLEDEAWQTRLSQFRWGD